MFSKPRLASQAASSVLVPCLLTLALLALLGLIGLPGCSGSPAGLSGRYQAREGTGRDAGVVTIDFKGSNTVNVSLGTAEKEEQLTHHCVYTVNGNKLTVTTDEPMGVPMSLLIEGNTLRDPAGFTYTKK
jgi:hypothetical protein